METTLHRFVRILRLRGVPASVAEAIDGLKAAAQPGVLEDREVLRAALAVSLIKDRRDMPVFDETFDRFFSLRPVLTQDPEHGHSHDDLSDDGELTEFSLSEEPGDMPQDGHSHGKPVDLHDFFRPEDLATQYNLHQEANRIDLASLTEQIVLSSESNAGDAADAQRVQQQVAETVFPEGGFAPEDPRLVPVGMPLVTYAVAAKASSAWALMPL